MVRIPIFILACAKLVAASCRALPRFHMTLTPDFNVEPYNLHGSITIDGHFAANDTIASQPLVIASVPSAQYPPDGLEATDADGILPLSSHDVEAGPYGFPTRYWTVTRASQGSVSFTFTGYPRIIDPETSTGPHFDLRNGTKGLTGSMWAIVPVPDQMSTTEYNLTLSWELDDDQKAAFTWADGVGSHSYSWNGTISDILQTYFIVGDVKAYPSIPSVEEDAFTTYWLDEPPFNVTEVAIQSQGLFQYSTEFWQDDSKQPYRIFIRVNEERGPSSTGRGNGGTALLRSFLVGYNQEFGIDPDNLEMLLAHEMTHNWTPWRGGTSAESSRYNEGAAEYWSLRLLWRIGAMSAETFLSEMNRRAYFYYNNPVVHMSDEEAMEVAWEIRDAQRIPYGRGMLHFTNIDGQLRAQSNGTQRLDDLAKPFVKECSTASCGPDTWFALLREALGQEAVDEWNRVSTGSPLLELHDGGLGPCFEVFQNGTDPVVYQWQAKEGVNISRPDCLI